MGNLRDKVVEYLDRGYNEWHFSKRRQISGYTVEIEVRKEEDKIILLYDYQKDICREKREKEKVVENAEDLVEKFSRKKK